MSRLRNSRGKPSQGYKKARELALGGEMGTYALRGLGGLLFLSLFGQLHLGRFEFFLTPSQVRYGSISEARLFHSEIRALKCRRFASLRVRFYG